ncbi:MAG: 16S rRNA (guanine(527)-N(7))-methyltransferase RsmG [Candidatus Gracilibacteria bacterium]|jgi:16S rRNA (guanine527-N7)-methyltransferase
MTTLVEVLQKKSAELNLFSAGDRLKLADKHIPDALAILDFCEIQAGDCVADIGTGGGLPGLALAQALPTASFTLMDATAKKITAVEAMAKELDLKNVTGLAGRFEALAHEKTLREHFDFATARAVAELPVLLEYASGFLQVGGSFYAWKSSEYEEELEQSRKAQEVLGLHFVRAHNYVLPGGEARAILEFKKTDRLEAKYPRKDGAPKAKPLV